MSQKHDAKQALLTALEAHAGDTNHQSVASAIDRLIEMNPTNDPATSELLQGNWLLINAPSFSGRHPDYESKYVYSLGRLAFNAFESSGLLIEIERVTQPILPTARNNEFTHDIHVEFKTIDRQIPELKGIVKNLAIFTPQSETTIEVEFTGGELMPLGIQNSEQMDLWLSVFGQKSPQFSLSIRERIMSLIVKWMFRVGKAAAIDPQTGRTAFAIDKSPKGILEILYLDEELRITKGKSGKVLISQRLGEQS